MGRTKAIGPRRVRPGVRRSSDNHATAMYEITPSNSTPAEIELEIDPKIDPAIESAEALAFWFSPLHCVIVWRDGPKYLRPADRSKRIRDIRPGDEVFWRDQPRTVRSVAVYR